MAMAMMDRIYSRSRLIASDWCLGLGVCLLVASGLSPVEFHPFVQLAVAVVLIGIAQILVPAPNRLQYWRNARMSDPAHELQLDSHSKVSSVLGNGQLPSNPTVETDARKNGARGSL